MITYFDLFNHPRTILVIQKNQLTENMVDGFCSSLFTEQFPEHLSNLKPTLTHEVEVICSIKGKLSGSGRINYQSSLNGLFLFTILSATLFSSLVKQ